MPAEGLASMNNKLRIGEVEEKSCSNANYGVRSTIRTIDILITENVILFRPRMHRSSFITRRCIQQNWLSWLVGRCLAESVHSNPIIWWIFATHRTEVKKNTSQEVNGKSSSLSAERLCFAAVCSRETQIVSVSVCRLWSLLFYFRFAWPHSHTDASAPNKLNTLALAPATGHSASLAQTLRCACKILKICKSFLCRRLHLSRLLSKYAS